MPYLPDSDTFHAADSVESAIGFDWFNHGEAEYTTVTDRETGHVYHLFSRERNTGFTAIKAVNALLTSQPEFQNGHDVSMSSFSSPEEFVAYMTGAEEVLDEARRIIDDQI